MKDPALADFDPADPPAPHPYADRDEVHEIYRAWRRDRRQLRRAAGAHRRGLAARRAERFAALPAPGRAAHRVQLRLPRLPLGRGRAAGRHRRRRSPLHAPVGAPATWVLSNHDVTRHVTRYGRADTRFSLDYRQLGAPDRPARWAPAGPGRPRCC